MNCAEQIYKEKGLEGLKEAYNELSNTISRQVKESDSITMKYDISEIPEEWIIREDELIVVDLKPSIEEVLKIWEEESKKNVIILPNNEPITKEYLIEEGWGVERNVFDSKNTTYFYTNGDLKILIYNGEIQIEDTSYSSEFPVYVYLGKIPTIEQWKTLKELLGI